MKNYIKKFIKMEANSITNNNTLYLIDAHCHFQYFTYDQIKIIISKCEKDNFSFYLSNSTTREDFDTTIKMAKVFPNIIPGVGHHPWYLENLVQSDNWFDEFVVYNKQLEESGIKYFIGEIGIDGGKPKK